MKKNKLFALILLVCAIIAYGFSAYEFFGGGSDSTGVVLLCAGSALLCFGAVFMNRSKKK